MTVSSVLSILGKKKKIIKLWLLEISPSINLLVDTLPCLCILSCCSYYLWLASFFSYFFSKRIHYFILIMWKSKMVYRAFYVDSYFWRLGQGVHYIIWLQPCLQCGTLIFVFRFLRLSIIDHFMDISTWTLYQKSSGLKV